MKPMTLEEKDHKALEKIAQTVDALDDTLDKLKDEDNKLKVWYEQKKAVHDIKKILSESITYDGYDESEYNAFMGNYNGFMYPDEFNQIIY